MELKDGRLRFEGKEMEKFHAVERCCSLGFLNGSGKQSSAEQLLWEVLRLSAAAEVDADLVDSIQI